MSNVLARFRGISEMEFYKVADDLRTELSTFLMNDKNVPKKWRAVISYPIIDLVQLMFDCMTDANSIYPYTPELVEERKRLQQMRIRCCDKIFERLQHAMRVVWWDRLHRDETSPERRRLEYHLDKIGDMLEREEKLLNGWRNSTKLLRRR